MKNLRQSLLIIGFGNQAQAWAYNLRDQGYYITIAHRKKSKHLKKIKKEKFLTLNLDAQQAIKKLSTYSPIVMSIPDDQHESFLQQYAHFFSPKTMIIYLHGFSVTRNQLRAKYPDHHHVLLAPKAIASELRNRFLLQKKTPGFICSHKNPLQARILKKLAQDLGLVLPKKEVTFEEETLSDLFSEQSLLCTLLPLAAYLSYQRLKEKGVSSELAYSECWFEMMLITKVLVEKGPRDFFNLISPNALLGSIQSLPLFERMPLPQALNQILKELDHQSFDQSYRETQKKKNQMIKKYFSDSSFEKIHGQWKKVLYE